MAWITRSNFYAAGLGELARQELSVAPRQAPTIAVAPKLLERAEPETAARLRGTAQAFARSGARRFSFAPSL